MTMRWDHLLPQRNRLAEQFKNGQITEKDLKKQGYTPDEIEKIKDDAADLAAKDRGASDRKKVIDSATRSKQHADQAHNDLGKNPNDPVHRTQRKTVQRQQEEIQERAREINKERRQRDRDGT